MTERPEVGRAGEVAGAVEAAGGAVPVLPAVPPVPGFGRANTTRLDTAGRLLQSLGRHIEVLADDNAIKDSSNESRESFKKDIGDLKDRLAEMERKLQAAIDEDNKHQAKKEKPAEEKPANAER